MGHPEYGVFVMAASIVAILNAVASFGLAPALVQLSPRAGAEGARLVLRLALTISSAIAAAVAVLTGIACLILGVDHFEELAVALAIMIPIAASAPLAASLSGYLQSVQQPKLLATALLAGPLVLSAIVVVLCLSSHPGASAVSGARTAAALVMLASLLLMVRGRGGIGHALLSPATRDAVNVGRVLALGGSLVGGALTAIVLAQLDVLVLGFSRGREIVALYAPASQIAVTAMTMAATIGTFYLPTIASTFARGDLAGAGDLYRWASRWAFVWVAPVIAVMLACPAVVLTLLFGNAYASMATPLRILTGGVLVNVLFGFNGPSVDSLNRIRLIIIRQAGALVFNVAACAALVPAFGADGAAVATSSSLLFANVVGSYLLHRQTRISPYNLRLLAVAGALGVAVGAGLALDRIRMASPVRIAVVALLAAGLCGAVAYLASSAEERRALRSGVARLATGLTTGLLSHPAV
jgi:O-antigen/teichoic acid export membrane protein